MPFPILLISLPSGSFLDGLCDLGGEIIPTAHGYPPMCTIVLEAGTKSASPM